MNENERELINAIRTHCIRILNTQLTPSRIDMQLILNFIEDMPNIADTQSDKLQIQLDMALDEIHILNQKIFKLKSNVENLINNL